VRVSNLPGPVSTTGGKSRRRSQELRRPPRAGTVRGVAIGRNQVRPQDLGRRVSFQYELPNGYVGEVVGILEAWDDAANTFLVRNRDGGLVRVPALGVRHGKIVPPSPRGVPGERS